jgi:hypothetical protein
MPYVCHNEMRSAYKILLEITMEQINGVPSIDRNKS